MSLIALIEQLRAGRSMARTLLLLIAVTGAVVVGLLAMHSLNTHTAAADTGHHATTTGTVAGADAGDHHTDDAATGESCADCGTGHSDMLTMACVLALLATVLILASPHNAQRWLSILPRPQPLGVAPPNAPGLPPPSLTTLCISRR